MHLVVSGYYGFDNIGDEAILFSLIQAIRDIEPDVTITVLSNNPESTSSTYNVQAINRWKMKEINKVLKHADGLISGGGSLLQDETGMKTIPYYAGIIKIAQWHKTPTFVYAQGIGPIKHSINKWITKKVFNKTDTITVRDEASQILLSHIGVKQPVTIVPDPVLGLSGSDYTNEWTKEKELNDFITVSVRDWPTEAPYKESIATCLDTLVKEGETIVFVPMHGGQDEATSKEVAALMTKSSHIAPANLTIGEKISVIGESKLLIGIRLHALIFAAINYTPFIALSYDPKIDAFADICQQPVLGHITKDTWNDTHLYDQVKDSLRHINAHEDLLRGIVKAKREEALEIPKLMFEMLKSK